MPESPGHLRIFSERSHMSTVQRMKAGAAAAGRVRMCGALRERQNAKQSTALII